MRSPTGTYAAVSVGDYQACAMGPDGRAVCWGESDESARPAPTMRLRAPRWVASSTIPVSWTSQPLFAPVETYDIRYAINPDLDHTPVWVPWRTATTTTHGRVPATSGQTYCIEGRATDGDGVASNWEGSCTTLPIDDGALIASDGWVKVRVRGITAGSRSSRRGKERPSSCLVDTGASESSRRRSRWWRDQGVGRPGQAGQGQLAFLGNVRPAAGALDRQRRGRIRRHRQDRSRVRRGNRSSSTGSLGPPDDCAPGLGLFASAGRRRCAQRVPGPAPATSGVVAHSQRFRRGIARRG
jgi:hypothetical protein